MKLLTVDDLHVYLGQSHVLQGVTFDVPEGGVTALLGRNGVGKTTTLRAILGLVGRRGSVRLAGEELTSLPTHRIVQRSVGYVPEDRDVFTGLTVAENLRLAERDAEPRYDLVYDLFPDLKARGDQRAGTLSGGQQQMLAIARALLNDNRVLLVDEPTKGLAPSLVAEVAHVLERLAEITTVLLVEQNLGVVRRIARGAIVLDQGRVVQRRVGYVPEDREVFTGLTVAENLRLAERDGEPRYDLVYDLFPDLAERGAQRAGTLSGGQQQMLAIGRALLNDNRVLLVDEPTKGLAPALVAEVARVLERLSELTTVLLVEQNLAVVRRIAHGAVVLDQGRVVHASDAKELLEQPELVKRLLSVGAHP